MPEKLTLEPTESHESEFKFWRKKFENYLRECEINDEATKLSRLMNGLDHKVYEHVKSEEGSYQTLMAALEKLFTVK